jgi:hypothetical protein
MQGGEMSDNLAQRAEFKKRVVAVSLTEDQQRALLWLQNETGSATQSAVVKLALEKLYAEVGSRD